MMHAGVELRQVTIRTSHIEDDFDDDGDDEVQMSKTPVTNHNSHSQDDFDDDGDDEDVADTGHTDILLHSHTRHSAPIASPSLRRH